MADNKVITFEAQAVLKNLRSTPQKSRRVINLVRDKQVNEARAILKFAPQSVSEPILKLLNSAVANALTTADRNGLKLAEESLFISEIFADEGPTMKRFRPRARGSAGRIFKRTSHITVRVGTYEEVIILPKSKDKKDAKKAKDNSKVSKGTVSNDSMPDKNEGPAKKDPSKAAGKKHRSISEKDVKPHGDKKEHTKPNAHLKENMRKKGA